jgi:hypothetical protein
LQKVSFQNATTKIAVIGEGLCFVNGFIKMKMAVNKSQAFNFALKGNKKQLN